MNRIRLLALASLLVWFAYLPFAAQAQLRAGADFSELKIAQPAEVPGKVEVIEFFWYGCPHCYSLEPPLEAWVKKLPADVHFRRIPAVLSDTWLVHARFFYAFEAMGMLDRVHKAFFDAIHKDRLILSNEAQMNEWFGKNGIERKKFDEVVKSFGVMAKVKRAAQLTTAYQVEGVPILAVHGRYTVNAEQGGSHGGMLANVDQLIDLARKGLGKK